jgi:hypothetical protein
MSKIGELRTCKPNQNHGKIRMNSAWFDEKGSM